MDTDFTIQSRNEAYRTAKLDKIYGQTKGGGGLSATAELLVLRYLPTQERVLAD